MTLGAPADLSWDPYDPHTFLDPYPVYRRLRDEAPIYRNDAHDFYAVARFDDVERVLVDRDTFVSRHGDILDTIQQRIEVPPGTLVFEEPPVHTIRRSLLSRVFTPKRMFDLEPAVRDFCRRRLDDVADQDSFDFVADLGAHVPMRVIGMLLGIPEADQAAIRDSFYDDMRAGPGEPADDLLHADMFGDYIDWRQDHPADDLMTVLLNAEFEDETGSIRRLNRREILSYVTVLAGAGNETTNLLIGWIGKVLGDHPDARREIVENRALVPNAIEELLRYE